MVGPAATFPTCVPHFWREAGVAFAEREDAVGRRALLADAFGAGEGADGLEPATLRRDRPAFRLPPLVRNLPCNGTLHGNRFGDGGPFIPTTPGQATWRTPRLRKAHSPTSSATSTGCPNMAILRLSRLTAESWLSAERGPSRAVDVGALRRRPGGDRTRTTSESFSGREGN
jgi:hypothetical protein